MKLATWNVNSLGARLPRVLEFLAEHSPDVVMLQETKCDDAAFPAAELALAGYDAVHHGSGRWAGVAILARSGLGLGETVAGLPGELRAEEARWIEASGAGGRERLRHERSRGGQRVVRREARVPRCDRRAGCGRARLAARDRRGLQRGARGPGRVRPGRLPRSDPRDGRGAHTIRARAERWGAGGRLPAGPSRRDTVHLVGLPSGPLPPRGWPADRL